MPDDNIYNHALTLFENRDYSGAFKLFQTLHLDYECGYCAFMMANLDDAETIWKKSKIDSPAVKWGLSLIHIINGSVPQFLSFFQIRNFLERDLTLLFENNYFDYANKVLDATDMLAEYNMETPKFIGRVLLNEGYCEQAFMFLKHAKDICYTDPEVDYLLAQYYAFIKDDDSAKNILKSSLKYNPNYFPIRLFLSSYN